MTIWESSEIKQTIYWTALSRESWTCQYYISYLCHYCCQFWATKLTKLVKCISTRVISTVFWQDFGFLGNGRLFGINEQSPTKHRQNQHCLLVHYNPPQEWRAPININISWQIALIPQWSVSIFTGTVSPVQRLKYPIWRALCFVSPADLISNKTMMCRDGKHTQGYLVHQCQDVQSSLTKQNQGLNLRKKNYAAFLKTFRSV